MGEQKSTSKTILETWKTKIIETKWLEIRKREFSNSMSCYVTFSLDPTERTTKKRLYKTKNATNNGATNGPIWGGW